MLQSVTEQLYKGHVSNKDVGRKSEAAIILENITIKTAL